jgi:type VI secretion system protein ImpM
MIVPSYFGKIPSRDDFVSSGSADHALVRHVDRWLGSCMSEFAQHAGWQAAYDTALPFDFLAASTDNGSVVCGRAAAGRDHSGRRSPLMGTLRIDTRLPVPFAAMGPLAFEQSWQGIGAALDRIMQLPRDNTGTLPTGTPCPVTTSPRALRALLDDYAATEPGPSLDALFAVAGHTNGVVAVARALRQVLAAVRERPHVRIDRGLVLPLPADPLRRPRVAAFWLDLVLTTLAGRDIEMVALLTHETSPRLIVSFDGTRSMELTAAWMPEHAPRDYLDLTRADPDTTLGRFGLPDASTLSSLRHAFFHSIRETRPCVA